MEGAAYCRLSRRTGPNTCRILETNLFPTYPRRSTSGISANSRAQYRSAWSYSVASVRKVGKRCVMAFFLVVRLWHKRQGRRDTCVASAPAAARHGPPRSRRARRRVLRSSAARGGAQRDPPFVSAAMLAETVYTQALAPPGTRPFQRDLTAPSHRRAATRRRLRSSKAANQFRRLPSPHGSARAAPDVASASRRRRPPARR